MVFYLNRFIDAQNANNSFEEALKEIEQGEKKSHWIWYVFPQIKGLGHSYMAQKYAISSLYEAYAFLNNPETRDRLYKATELLNECNQGKDIESVMGSHIDAIKLKSSMTLFDIIEPDSVFDRALRYFFNEERDDKTLAIVAEELKKFKDNPFKKFEIHNPERAYFDNGCHEALSLTEDERLATFIDLKLRGYSLAQLCRNYLVGHRDLFDFYRTHNLEITLGHLASQALMKSESFLEEKNDMLKTFQLYDLFPLEYFDSGAESNWEMIAMRVELLLDFILRDEILSKMAEKLITDSSSVSTSFS